MAYYRASGGSEKAASGSVTLSTSSTTTVSIGFKPKKLTVRQGTNTVGIYDEEYSTTKYFRANTGAYLGAIDLGTTSANRLYSINDDGFTYNKSNSSSNVDLYYFAVG